MTIDGVRILCEELAHNLGMEFDCPVRENGRLRTSLGRVIYEHDKPIVLEMNKTFLHNGTDFDVRNVVMHEFAHWCVAVREGHPHGHDAVFKSCCSEIGCTNDSRFYEVEDGPQLYKYDVICPDCGAVSHYSRKCDAITHPEWYRCGRCEGENLYVKQNY